MCMVKLYLDNLPVSSAKSLSIQHSFSGPSYEPMLSVLENFQKRFSLVVFILAVVKQKRSYLNSYDIVRVCQMD